MPQTRPSEEILMKACDAAKEAGDRRERELTDADGNFQWFPCGFAWIKISPARGKLVTYLKNHGVGKTDSYEGGYRVSVYEIYPTLSNQANQSMEVKYAAAAAFAEVLQENGINAYPRSAID